MKALIDCDILVYECAFAGEYKDEDTGERIPRDFETVKEVFEQRLHEIEDAVWANEESLLFLTGDERLLRLENRERKRAGLEPLVFRPNFRYDIAVSKGYKDRKSNKPYHFHNLRSHIRHNYPCHIAWGMEADDALAIHQTRRLAELDTVICSRDKDLRMVPGMQYGWECANQPSFGPKRVEEIGELELDGNKLRGEGLKFFYAQLITGDTVDTIPGLPRGGPALAFKTLSHLDTEEEMYEAVAALYEAKKGEEWETYLQEQANLLWMVRETDEEGKPILFVPPTKRES